MGCPTANTKEMIRCLQYRPARAIVETVGDFMVSSASHLLCGRNKRRDSQKRKRFQEREYP
jgi:hypothetical protein